MLTQDKSGLYEYLPGLIRLFLAFLILGTALYGAVSDQWEQFVVCSPIAIALIPGYLQLLPRGGMRHGSICGCAKPDAAYELGFWSEHGQRVILLLPLVLAMMFLYSVFVFHNGFHQALIDTSLAALAAIMYSMVSVAAFCFMVVWHNRD